MKGLTFSDVLIIPKFSTIRSRKDVSLESDFGFFYLKLPIFAANMKTICGPKMAIAMLSEGAMGILHRFNTIEQAIDDFMVVRKFCDEKELIAERSVGVSIGINDSKRTEELYNAGARIFCVDVAHGHTIMMKECLDALRNKYQNNIYIIAGNVATAEAAYDLGCNWGADCVKVGIGSGEACLTRKNTGVGFPQLTAIQLIKEDLVAHGKENVKLISDGGIKTTGCISKSYKYADGTMLGSFISGTTETNGNVYRDSNGSYYKVYQGSASGENKAENGNAVEFVEGCSKQVPFRGHVKYILREIKDGVTSAFSYVGASDKKTFSKNCEFIEISSGSKVESKL